LRPGTVSNAAAQAAGPTGVGALVGGSGTTLGPTNHSQAEVLKVAKQFEAIFLRMLLREMRSTVEKNALFGTSRALETFESMQDEQYAERLSSQGMGLGDMVYRQLAAAVERQQTALNGGIR
jgi:flagellar protein FlgJ